MYDMLFVSIMQAGVPDKAVSSNDSEICSIRSDISSLLIIPKTAAYAWTISCLTFFLSIIASASLIVVWGLTANTGLVIISRSLTFEAFLPCDVTLNRMSVLLTMPTISPLTEIRTLRAFFSCIPCMASSAVLSDSRMGTSDLIISPTGDASRAPTFERSAVLLPPSLLMILRASFLLNNDSSAQTHIIIIHLLVFFKRL